MKKLIFILFAMLLTVSMAGCSSDNSSGSGDGDNGNGDAKTVEDGKKVELTIGLPGGDDNYTGDIIDAFEKKYTNITVKRDKAPWGDFFKKLQTKISGGTAPDIWWQENARVVGDAERGVAEDISDRMGELDKGKYSNLEIAEWDGKIYGIPHDINNVALAYNLDLFDKYDVDYPTDDWTYNDILDAAKELTQEKDENGMPHIWGMNRATSITTGWFPWIKANGGRVLSEDGTKYMLTDPKSIEGIEKLRDVDLKLGVTPPEGIEEKQGGKLWGNGKMAMDVLFQYSNIALYEEKYPELNFDFVQVPIGFDGERHTPMITNSWEIFSKASDDAKDAAWLFMKFYLNEESQQKVADSKAGLPVLTSALDQLADNDDYNVKAFIDGLGDSAETMAVNPLWTKLHDEMGKYIPDMMHEKISVKEGLQKVQDELQPKLDDLMNE